MEPNELSFTMATTLSPKQQWNTINIFSYFCNIWLRGSRPLLETSEYILLVRIRAFKDPTFISTFPKKNKKFWLCSTSNSKSSNKNTFLLLCTSVRKLSPSVPLKYLRAIALCTLLSMSKRLSKVADFITKKYFSWIPEV